MSACFLSVALPAGAASGVNAPEPCASSKSETAILNVLDDVPQGQSRPLRTEYFADPTGIVTAQNIDAQPFTERSCAVSYPISSPQGAVWFRFTAANPHEQSVKWVVTFMDTILDEVTLFEKQPAGLTLVAQNGRAIRAGTQAPSGAKVFVPLALMPGEEKQFFMRVSGTFASQITPVLVSADLFDRWSKAFDSVSAILLGFTAILAVFSVLLFRHVSARFYRYYTLFVVASFLFTFVYDGWINRVFGISAPVTEIVPLIQLFAGGAVIVNIQYCRVLLAGGNRPRGQKRTLQVLTTAALIMTGLAIYDPWVYGLPLQLLFFVSPIVLLVLAVRRLGHGMVQVVPICASLLCLISGLTVATYFFIYPVRVSETSSAFDLMMMRPTTISYALAIIGEAFFMMVAISAMLNAIRQQTAQAIREADALRDTLTRTEETSARMLNTKSAQILALSEALAKSPENDLLPAEDRFLGRATQCVIDNVSTETYGTKELAFDLGVSEKTLGRRLKDVSDLTPAAFVRSVRLSFARDLVLRRYHKSVSEIAYASGFSSVRHFSRLYRTQFQETPSETMKSLKS